MSTTILMVVPDGARGTMQGTRQALLNAQCSWCHATTRATPSSFLPKWFFPPGVFSSSMSCSKCLPLTKVNSFQWWEAFLEEVLLMMRCEYPKHVNFPSCVCCSIRYRLFHTNTKLLTKPSLFSINNAFEIILTPISGRQVVVGGYGNLYSSLSSVETYPPLQEGCSIPALEEARYRPTLSILPGNRLVVCGGETDDYTDLASCVSWTPGQEKWSSFATMRWQSLFARRWIFDDYDDDGGESLMIAGRWL